VKGRLDNPASHRQSLLARRTALKRYWANPGGAERGGDGARDTACDRLKPGMQAGGQAAFEGEAERLMMLGSGRAIPEFEEGLIRGR
jgi:hypothetical protein